MISPNMSSLRKINHLRINRLFTQTNYVYAYYQVLRIQHCLGIIRCTISKHLWVDLVDYVRSSLAQI